jgi:hypothetical protein
METVADEQVRERTDDELALRRPFKLTAFKTAGGLAGAILHAPRVQPLPVDDSDVQLDEPTQDISDDDDTEYEDWQAIGAATLRDSSWLALCDQLNVDYAKPEDHEQRDTNDMMTDAFSADEDDSLMSSDPEDDDLMSSDSEDDVLMACPDDADEVLTLAVELEDIS